MIQVQENKSIIRPVYAFRGLPIGYGCVPGGFGEECNNCCAIPTAQRISGTGGQAAELIKKVTTRTDGKICWSGDIRQNLRAYDLLTEHGTPQNFLASYTCEIALLPAPAITRLVKKIYEYPIHIFTLLTKLPLRLYKSMMIASNKMRELGVDITELSNMRIATSVGFNKTKYRIDELKKFKGFNLELFIKPLIGPVNGVNYEGISTVRINCEKGYKNKIRPYKQEWIDTIFKEARKFRTKVYNDIEI
jgi:protein gp37